MLKTSYETNGRCSVSGHSSAQAVEKAAVRFTICETNTIGSALWLCALRFTMVNVMALNTFFFFF